MYSATWFHGNVAAIAVPKIAAVQGAAAIDVTAVAQRAGLRQPDVSRLESGGGTPTIGMLERLAHALELRFVARFERTDAA